MVMEMMLWINPVGLKVRVDGTGGGVNPYFEQGKAALVMLQYSNTNVGKEDEI